MPTDRKRLPLPDEFLMHPTQGECYTLNQLHAYSDAECAPLMEEIEALRQGGSKLTADNAALQTTLADSRAYVERLKSMADEHRNGRLAALEELAALRAELEEWRFTNRVDELDRHVTRLSEQVRVLRDALEQITRHFTKAQSTLADTEMRGMAHRVLKDTK